MTVMKSLPVFSFLLALIFTFTFTHAVRFDVTNRCSYPVSAATTIGQGKQLNPGQTWPLDVPAGTSNSIWGNSETGQATLAEFVLNAYVDIDYYDISVIEGFNIPMEFSPTSNGCRSLRCDNAQCPDAFHNPDDQKTFSCAGGTNYRVVFCP